MKEMENMDIIGGMNYDPNLVLCGRSAVQVIKLIFGQWDYRAQIVVKTTNNLTGMEAINYAIHEAFETLPEKTFKTPEGHKVSVAEIQMTNSSGGVLDCSDDELDYQEWLQNMLISAEITSITAA